MPSSWWVQCSNSIWHPSSTKTMSTTLIITNKNLNIIDLLKNSDYSNEKEKKTNNRIFSQYRIINILLWLLFLFISLSYTRFQKKNKLLWQNNFICFISVYDLKISRVAYSLIDEVFIVDFFHGYPVFIWNNNKISLIPSWICSGPKLLFEKNVLKYHHKLFINT